MDQEKTYKWIQDRLRELNAGTISDADFRQLQALSKEDPFVADALEGFQAHAHLDHAQYLDSLASQIKPQKRARRRWLIPNLTVTAVAASLILIVGFYAVMSRLDKKENENATAVVNEHELNLQPSGDSAGTYALTGKDDSIAKNQPMAVAEAPRKEMVKEPASKASPRTQPSLEETKVIASNTSSSRDEVLKPADDISAAGAAPMMSKSMELPVVPEGVKDEKGEPYYANQMDPAVMARRVTGRVTTTDGDPLIGVSLFIPGTNLATTSQLDGKFELFLPEADNQVELVYGGYEKEVIHLQPGAEDVQVELKAISLADHKEAAENVAAASRAKNEASPKLPGTKKQTDVQYLFLDYLKTNSRFPLANDLNGDYKAVSLEFMINTDGHPGQIKVVTGSGNKELDEEAVRLIKKGPDWECESGYPCEGRYTIYFRSE